MRQASRISWLLTLTIALAPVSDADGRRRGRHITGKLVIESATTGARVFIDGDEVGRIPLGQEIRLMPGKHVVKVVKPGHTQYMESVTIRRGRTVRLEVDLFPIKGVVSVATQPPGARVYIDGKFAGKTPLSSLVLDPGKHRVRIARVGFYDVIRTMQVDVGKHERISVSLKSLPDEINPLIPKKKPQRWYEKWWVWVSAAGGLVALATAIAVPLAVSGRDPVGDFNPDRIFTVP